MGGKGREGMRRVEEEMTEGRGLKKRGREAEEGERGKISVVYRCTNTHTHII